MPQIFGSYNSRFFAVLNEGRLAMYRGAAPLWTRPVAAARELLRVGNQGDVFLRTADGVARLALSRDAELEPVHPLADLVAGDDGGLLGGVKVNAEGTEFCIERITSSARLSRKLLRMLRRGENPQAEARVEEHELLFYNRNTGGVKKFGKTEVDPERNGRFVWTASPNLAFLLVGVSGIGRKGHMTFRLIHTREETVYSEFEMKIQDVSNLWVTENGSVLLEIRVSEREAALVLTTLEGDKVVMTPPANSEVLNLGHRMVTLRTGPEPRIIIRSFADETICQADLGPLGRLGLEYDILFNERGGLDLVTLKGQELRVNHTDTESLAVDARRWGMLATQQESAEQENVEREAQKLRQDEERSRRQEERSRELARALDPAPLVEEEPALRLAVAGRAVDTPAVPTDIERRRKEIETDLERARMRFVAGAMDRNEYHETVRGLNVKMSRLVAEEQEPPDEPIPAPEAAPAPAPPAAPAPAATRARGSSSSVPAASPPASQARSPLSLSLDPIPAPSSRPAPGTEYVPPSSCLPGDEFERQKAERLLSVLEERLARRELSEATYNKLKERFQQRQSAP